MSKRKQPPEIKLEITYTEGYQQRFTLGILKILEKRLAEQERQEAEQAEITA